MDASSTSAALAELPLSETWRAQLLDAAILAGVLVARSRGPIGPADRLCLLNAVRRCGLAGTPPTVDVMARFDLWLRRTADPRQARRTLSRAMNEFVGTPWAALILRVAETVADAYATVSDSGEGAEQMAISAIRLGLGLCSPEGCHHPG